MENIFMMWSIVYLIKIWAFLFYLLLLLLTLWNESVSVVLFFVAITCLSISVCYSLKKKYQKLMANIMQTYFCNIMFKTRHVHFIVPSNYVSVSSNLKVVHMSDAEPTWSHQLRYNFWKSATVKKHMSKHSFVYMLCYI